MRPLGSCFILVIMCGLLGFAAALQLGEKRVARRDSNAGADNPATCPDENFNVETLECKDAPPASERQVLTPSGPPPHGWGGGGGGRRKNGGKRKDRDGGENGEESKKRRQHGKNKGN